MNWTSVCGRAVEEYPRDSQPIIRRRIWPAGAVVRVWIVEGRPCTFVETDPYGRWNGTPARIGFTLYIHGQLMVDGWSPSIEDAMGQDWEFVSK
jgi:hypothetical protein